MSATRFRQRRLYQQVAEDLARRIQAGEFAARRTLPGESELAVGYGVGRNVMREALVALEILGLVSVRAGAGAFVNDLPQPIDASLAEVTASAGPSPQAILEARRAIEGEVAFAAALAATPAELDALEALLNRAAAAESRAALEALDWPRVFHLRLAEATHNPVFVSVVAAIWEAVSGPMFAGLRARVALKKLESHIRTRRRVLDRLRRRDGGGARAAMRAHVDMVLHDLYPAEGAEASPPESDPDRRADRADGGLGARSDL